MPPFRPSRALTGSAVLLLVAAPAAVAKSSATTTSATTPAPAGAVAKQGVKVRGVDVSGLTRDQVITRLRPTLRDHRPSNASLVVKIGNRPHRITMEKLSYATDLGSTASRAVRAKAGTSVAVVPTWDRKALTSWLTSLGKIGRKSRNASVKLGITKQRVTGSRNGWRVSPDALRSSVTRALEDPSTPRELVQKVVRVRPSVTINRLRSQNGTVVSADRRTFKLRLFKRLRLVKTYRIAVGAAGHGTPAGRYTVTSRQVNPVWHVPNSAWAGSLAGKTIPGGAANNPLKARWLGLRDGIGIHGTAETWSLGSRASHGCLRMHPNDVIALYRRVPMGTPVLIR